MKRIIVAVLILMAGVVAGCQSAHAQLTPEHTGHYYDPSASGQGVELHVTDSGQVIGTFFLGSVPGWYASPAWLSAQGDVDDQTLPLYQSISAVFGASYPLILGVMGSVTLTAIADCSGGEHCLDAQITIDGRGFVLFSPAPEPVSHTLRLRRLL